MKILNKFLIYIKDLFNKRKQAPIWRLSEKLCPRCTANLLYTFYGTYNQFTDRKCEYCGYEDIMDVI